MSVGLSAGHRFTMFAQLLPRLLACYVFLGVVHSQEKQGCDAQADILLIMDSSGSIGQVNYAKMLTFVANLTHSFKLGPKDIQFGAIIIGNTAHNVFSFGAHTNHTALENAILSTKYLAEGTSTDAALKFARLQSFTSVYGARPGIAHIAIILTDGSSNKPLETAKEAKFLKDAGVQVLSIGIGTNINNTELQIIASSPGDVFQVNNFNIMDTIAAEVTNKTCEQDLADEFLKMFTAASAAQRLKNMGVHIMTIGIGDVNNAELNNIATAPGDVFQADSYEVLHQLQNDVVNHTCNLTKPPISVIHRPCGEMADIIFVIDSSSSIPSEEYEKQLLFASNLTQEFDVGPVDARFAAVVFSNDVLRIFDLEAFSNHFNLYHGLLSSPHLTGTADIGNAFNWVNDMEMFSSLCGGRDNASKIIVLFADNPSVDPAGAIHAADRLKKDGVHITVIGINNYDLYEIRTLASSPSSAFKATSIDSLHWIQRSLVDDGILGIRYLAQNTFTNKALILARLEAFTAAHGGRGNVPKIAIVFTDGQSSLPTETSREAQLLKDSGVLILSVGIGETVKYSELEAIASLPEDVFQVNSFAVLSTIQKSLTNKTCEKVTGSQASPCSKLADIIFLLDSSGSISSEDYHQQLLFAANFTDNFQIGPEYALFGAVIFSDIATKLFDLNKFSDHWSILQTLLDAPHLKGGNNTAQALDMIFNEGLFNVSGGGRSNATKMLIIMTDGQSANVSQYLADEFLKMFTAASAAQRLKNMGVHIMTIGIGDVNNAELNNIATAPGDVFQADSYEVLHQLQNDVVNHTCNLTKPPISVIHRPCGEMADIIFVIDSSSSIPSEEYEKQLLFASNLTQEFDVGPVDARFAAVVFSNDVLRIFDLEAFSNHFNLYHGLLSSPHLTGTADIGNAFNWVNDMEMFSSLCGGRDNASKIIVLFADNPSVDPAGAIHAADRLKKDGVHITVIGINNYDLYEIRTLASSPSSAFKATSIDSLHWIQRSLVDDLSAEAPEDSGTSHSSQLFREH